MFHRVLGQTAPSSIELLNVACVSSQTLACYFAQTTVLIESLRLACTRGPSNRSPDRSEIGSFHSIVAGRLRVGGRAICQGAPHDSAGARHFDTADDIRTAALYCPLSNSFSPTCVSIVPRAFRSDLPCPHFVPCTSGISSVSFESERVLNGETNFSRGARLVGTQLALVRSRRARRRHDRQRVVRTE